VTHVAKAAAVLVVTVTRSERGESEDALEQRIEVAEALVREGGGEVERTGRDALVGGFPAVTAGVTTALAIRDRLSGAVCIGMHAGEVVLTAEGAALRAAVEVAGRLAAAAHPGTIVVSDAARPALPAGTDVQAIEVDGLHAFLILSSMTGRAWRRRTVVASIAGAAALGAIGAILVIAVRRRTPVPGERRLTLAVMQYKVSAVAPDDAWIRDAVRDGLNTQLSELAGVKVYSREFLDFIMSHGKTSEIEVATKLGIDKMLTGSVTVMGGAIRVDTQIVDVPTGMIESAFMRIGRRADFLRLESEVILGAIEKFDVRLTEEEKERLAARRESDVDVLRRLLEIEGETPVPPAGPPSERVPAPDAGSWLGPRAAWADDEAVAQTAIMAFLERYRAATEAGDVTALAAMYADFSADQRAALERYFGTVKDLRVSIEKVDVAIFGDEAVVTYSRTDDFVDVPRGRRMNVTVRVTKTLRRVGSEWKFAPT
jgi:TolB-like protein/ketosteroid isomerase-like protein